MRGRDPHQKESQKPGRFPPWGHLPTCGQRWAQRPSRTGSSEPSLSSQAWALGRRAPVLRAATYPRVPSPRRLARLGAFPPRAKSRKREGGPRRGEGVFGGLETFKRHGSAGIRGSHLEDPQAFSGGP